MVPKLKSHQICLKMSTQVNLKVLNTNLTGFSFSQNLLLLWSNFERITCVLIITSGTPRMKYWWATGSISCLNYWDTRLKTWKHWNKGVHWHEKGFVSSTYSCLHFIQFSGWFAKHKDKFYSGHHSFYRYCVPVSRINVKCVFLASALNRVSVLLEMLSQYLATFIIRGVFRAQ